MAYNMFSQLAGPNISLSLYGDAANAGINGGNAQKTAIQSAISGAVQGYETGQRITQNNQVIAANAQLEQIRQNQINQLPIVNQIQQEQLESQQRANDINALAYQNSIALNGLSQQNQELKLKKENAEILAQQKELDNKTTIENYATNGNLNDAEKLLSDPSLRRTLLNNPDLAEVAFSSPSVLKAYTPAQRTEAEKIINDGIALKYKQANQAGYQKSYQKTKEEMNEALGKVDPSVWAAVGNSSDPQNLNEYEFVPKGYYTKNKFGKTVRGDKINFSSPMYEIYRGGVYVGEIERELAKTGTTAQQAMNAFDQASANITGYKLPEPPPVDTPKTQEQDDAEQQALQDAIDEGELISGETEKNYTPIASAPANDVIRQQTRAAYQTKLSSSSLGKSAEEVYKEKQQEIRKKYNPPLPTPTNTIAPSSAGTPSSQSEGTTTPTAGILSMSGKGFKPVSMTYPVNTSPSVILTSQLKSPVTVNFTPPVFVKGSDTIVQRINSEPLLVGETPLIKGLSFVESAGKRDAVSPTGVRGLLQVTKATAAYWGLDRDIPEQNVQAGKLTLAQNLQMFDNNLPLALAAYNAGPSIIKQAVLAAGTSNWQDVKEYLRPILSKAKFKEVSEYPEKVMTAALYFTGDNKEYDDSYFESLNRSNQIKILPNNPLGLGTT